MKQSINNNSRGVIELAALLVYGLIGAGGVYVYQHEQKINQLSRNQSAMGQDIELLGNNAASYNRPAGQPAKTDWRSAIAPDGRGGVN